MKYREPVMPKKQLRKPSKVGYQKVRVQVRSDAEPTDDKEDPKGKTPSPVMDSKPTGLIPE